MDPRKTGRAGESLSPMSTRSTSRRPINGSAGGSACEAFTLVLRYSASLQPLLRTSVNEAVKPPPERKGSDPALGQASQCSPGPWRTSASRQWGLSDDQGGRVSLVLRGALGTAAGSGWAG